MTDDPATADFNVVVYRPSASNSVDAIYAVFQTTVIPEVTLVRLYAETVGHATEGHADAVGVMPGIIQAVAIERAIADPSHVEKSYGNSYVYVDATTMNASGEPLRVPVKVIEGTSAMVKTYFFATKSGNVTKVYERATV